MGRVALRWSEVVTDLDLDFIRIGRRLGSSRAARPDNWRPVSLGVLRNGDRINATY